MKDMRQLINLMEGVMAVPGVGGAEANMQTAGTVGRNSAYAAYDASQQPASESKELDEKAPPGMEDMVMKLKKEYPGEEDKAFATAWSIYNKKHGNTEEGCTMEEGEGSRAGEWAMMRFNELINSYVDPQEAFDIVIQQLRDQGVDEQELASVEQDLLSTYGSDDGYDEPSDGMTDAEADADALASAGMGSDEDYGDFGHDEFEEAFDLNNGYDDINDASGNDFFPNGADSPVVRSVGPSGARQGDNPEQKKMQVAEVHKELVYGYRNYLKETANAESKKKVN